MSADPRPLNATHADDQPSARGTSRSAGRAREICAEGRAWIIPLPYERPPLNLNQRLHWAARNRLVQQIKSDVHTLARFHKLPTGLDRVHVTLHWQPTTNRRRDSDNPSLTLKACVDGLTTYGLTDDDNSEHVTSGTVIEPRAAVAAVWLTIQEIT